MADQIWRLHVGHGPLVATAIHDGSEFRPEVDQHLALDKANRLREEDPFTAIWTEMAPTRIIGLRSRFEVDLNRPRETAVYQTPDDAWGLKVWKSELPADIVRRSLAEYDAFYRSLGELYSAIAAAHGAFVVFDLHSYNHRRLGMNAEPADNNSNPTVNIGTGTMRNREKFARLIDRFKHDLSSYEFPGGRLDVRENVKFFGGQHPRWAHARFPDTACVLAIEFKKTFMDEWTGIPDWPLVEAIGDALKSTVTGVMEELDRLKLCDRSTHNMSPIDC